MPVPKFPTVILPVLKFAAMGEFDHPTAVKYISDEFGLTHEEREELVPSGTKPRIDDRVNWAMVYLHKAGLLTRPRRGRYIITGMGQSVLASKPDRIDNTYLSKFEGFRKFQVGDDMDRSTRIFPSEKVLDQVPADPIVDASSDRSRTLNDELLRHIQKIKFINFKQFIIDLMSRMSYNIRKTDLETFQNNNSEINCIFNMDALGVDIVFLRAMQEVGRIVDISEVHEFSSALDVLGIARGVLITTSSFAPDAKDVAQSICGQKSLHLVDGEELVRLTIEYGVGVRKQQMYAVEGIDNNYFNEIEE